MRPAGLAIQPSSWGGRKSSRLKRVRTARATLRRRVGSARSENPTPNLQCRVAYVASVLAAAVSDRCRSIDPRMRARLEIDLGAPNFGRFFDLGRPGRHGRGPPRNGNRHHRQWDRWGPRWPLGFGAVHWRGERMVDGNAEPDHGNPRAGGHNSTSGDSRYLGLGVYQANVAVSAQGAANGPIRIAVRLTIDPRPPAKLAIVTQASAQSPNGVAFDRQPMVQLLNAIDEPAAKAGVVVAVTIGSGGGQLTGSTTAVTGPDGRATFSGLSLLGRSATGRGSSRLRMSPRRRRPRLSWCRASRRGSRPRQRRFRGSAR